LEQVDAVVVGAGAGGGIVAKELAVAGLRVMLLDRGPSLTASDFGHDELFDSQERWNPHGLRFGPYRGEVQSFRPDVDKPSRVVTPSDANFSAVARCVGGGTRSYQGLSWRYHPGTFRLKTLYGVPAGSTVEDWPISYDDLEPYYEKAEYDLGVCGEPGPYGPSRHKDYPMPPLPDNREAEVLFPAARRLGWKPFHPPLAILSQPYRGRPACIRCPFCISYGCEADAKSDTAVTVITEALKTRLCTLRAETLVREITVDARGRPNGVVCRTGKGPWQEISARVIVVAASATETPRLLLNSRSKWFPTGLGNQHDQVGRHVNQDQGAVVFGFFDEVVADSLGPGPSVALDFQFEHAEVPAGGVIYNSFSRLPIRVVDTVPRPDGIKSWGREFKDFYRRYFWKHIRAYCIAHGIPREGNRVDLDPELRDSDGIRAARVTNRAHAWSFPQQEWLASRAEILLKEAGAKFTIRPPVGREPAGSLGQHQSGSCRMGTDSRSSVTDRTGRLHDVPNVFVADGSLMTSAGGGNPCLTIQALAYWVSDHIVRAWRGGGLNA
jgi:choline dehydrogenase-like flavoprotein